MKKEYVVLGVVIAALAIYLVLRNTNRTRYELPEIARVDSAAVTRIVITRGDSSFALERQDDRWLIEPPGYPADAEQVGRMLSAVKGLTLVTLVSEAKSYEPFDLEGEKKIGIEVFGGSARLIQLDIGKPASTYRHTYVRLAGDDNVYQARENIRQPFEAERARLRDRIVSRFDTGRASAITFAEAGRAPFAVRRIEQPPAPVPASGDSSAAVPQGPAWASDDGRPVRADVVEAVINACAKMQCDSYIEGAAKTDFVRPIFTLTIEADAPDTIRIYEKRPGEENRHPALSSQSEYPFLLPVHTVKQLMKKPEDILDQPKK